MQVLHRDQETEQVARFLLSYAAHNKKVECAIHAMRKMEIEEHGG